MTKIESIKASVPCTRFLKKAKKGGYICPWCGSGTGKNGTGALKYYEDSNRVKCHAGDCGKSGSVIDVYMATEGADLHAAIEALWDGGRLPVMQHPTPKALTEKKTWDFSEQYKRANELLQAAANCQEDAPPEGWTSDDVRAAYDALSYLMERGINLDRAVYQYGLGFNPRSDPAGSKYFYTPRIIIPVSPSYYVARRIDNDEWPKALGPKDATVTPWNIEALKDGGRLFVVEGVFDAMSIQETELDDGTMARAISINSAEHAPSFLEAVKDQRPPVKEFLIALDDDRAGQTRSKELVDGLQALGYVARAVDITGGEHDANDALRKDRDTFFEAVRAAVTPPAPETPEARPFSMKKYLQEGFDADAERYKRFIPTGFEMLDKKMAGGLRPGLYILAGGSSMGKTSFVSQIADHVAAAGRDVLLFAEEMSRYEMLAKSMARFAGGTPTAQEIMTYGPGDDLRQQYDAAMNDRLSCYGDDFSSDVTTVRTRVEEHIARTQTQDAPPLVIVDYLQVLQPSEEAARGGKREAVDDIVVKLQQMARATGSPVILLSSMSRKFYTSEFSFEALKESGGTEYTATGVWGLVFYDQQHPRKFEGKAAPTTDKMISRWKQETPRRVSFVCLKSRFGQPVFEILFNYYPARELFEESREVDAVEDAIINVPLGPGNDAAGSDAQPAGGNDPIYSKE